MKLKEKTKKKIRGSVTVLLVIILLPMLTFSAIIVDMSRMNMAREMMSSAGDLTMNTALANYDTILKDVYGLFAMSQDGKAKTDEELAADLKQYFAETISGYGVVSKEDADGYVSLLIGDFTDLVAGGNVETTDFLKLDNLEVKAERLPNSSLAKPDILRKQIVEYMKYRAPLNFGMGFLDSLKAFQAVEDQNKVVESQVKTQESTQDVTQACSKLIKLIREYDKLVKSMDTEDGGRAVRGVNKYDDGQLVRIMDYDTQLDKYRTAWPDNYAHINKLDLVFFGNQPSLDGKYLKEIALKGSEMYFIKDGGAGLNMVDSSGISISVDLTDDKDGAQQQYNGQVAVVNGYKDFANSFSGKNFLYSGNLTLHADGFTDEAAAVNSYIEFEQFLLNQSSGVNYSDAAKLLEEIYKLDKYYGKYDSFLKAEVDQAQAEVDAAQTRVNTANAAVTQYQNIFAGARNSINRLTRDYVDGVGGMDNENCLSFLSSYTDLKQDVANLLGQLPAINGYRGFYNGYLAGTNGDRYLTVIRDICDKFTSGEDGTICTETKNYVNSNSAQSYESYMKSAVNNDVVKRDLFKLLNCLVQCSKQTLAFSGNLDAYDASVQELNSANAVLSEKQRILANKKSVRDSAASEYHSVLSFFMTFDKVYETAFFYYSQYQSAAKATMAAEAGRIQDQSSKIKNNIGDMRSKLEAISNQIAVVKKAIKTYNENLDAWETANNNYEAKNEGDSFSKQTASDIATARSEYDLDAYDDLDEFIVHIWDYIDDFYSYLTDETHLKYGSKKIYDVKGGDDLISAISGIKAELPAVVTLGEAEGRFPGLYNEDKTPEYDPSIVEGAGDTARMYFLDPQPLPITILKYLNSAYQDEEIVNKVEKVKNKNEEVKTEYETQKNALVSGEPAKGADNKDDKDKPDKDKPKVDVDNTKNEGKFGYTYSFVGNLVADNLPSKGGSQKEVSESQYKLEETGEEGSKKLNASGSVSKQSGNLSKVLSGIGSAIEAGLENAYILTYIFENFSYNTMVQDAAIQGEKLSGENSLARIASAEGILSNGKTMGKYIDKIPTLSNFYKNGRNNMMYGAEAEYILYGNLDPSKNVTYAKASIYAIRFGFNCIYAFTNSEIRNSTMAAGLAVQAATMGIVPYQVVQIVLQLALAAAESAIDLKMMNDGLKVAVVKTKDTWALSISGAAGAVSEIATTALTKVATGGIQALSNGLQGIVDAGADELKGAIYDLSEELGSATQQALIDVVDRAFASIIDEMAEGLNALQYVEVTANETAAEINAKMRAEVDKVFGTIENGLSAKLNQMFAGNDLAMKILPEIESAAKEMLTKFKTEVIADINKATEKATELNLDLSDHITAKMYDFKLSLITYADQAIQNVTSNINEKAKELVSGVQGELKDYIGQIGEDMEEKAAEEIKKQVQDLTNQYIGTNLDVGNGNAIGGGSTSSNVASMIKFGYKDYLMLFTFLSVCVNDDPILMRTADVIQLNLQSAGEGAEFSHKCGTGFKMENAYTYLSFTATADLDMFFMDLSIFQDMVREDPQDAGGAPEGEQNGYAAITYKGVLGY